MKTPPLDCIECMRESMHHDGGDTPPQRAVTISAGDAICTAHFQRRWHRPFSPDRIAWANRDGHR